MKIAAALLLTLGACATASTPKAPEYTCTFYEPYVSTGDPLETQNCKHSAPNHTIPADK